MALPVEYVGQLQGLATRRPACRAAAEQRRPGALVGHGGCVFFLSGWRRVGQHRPDPAESHANLPSRGVGCGKDELLATGSIMVVGW